MMMTLCLMGVLLLAACAGGSGGGDDDDEEPKNREPTASIATNVTTGVAPLDVDFDASASSDDDGHIVDYAWVFGDGAADTGVTVGHRYDDPGTYTATLTVTDDDGATDVDSVEIRVGSAGTDIGPTGGTAVSEDGQVEVVIPAGALPSTQTITVVPVAQAPAGALGGAVYEFGPSGLRFDLPVTLHLEYDEAALPAGLDEESLSVAALVNGVFWHEVVGASIDAAQDTVTVQASHFSTYGLMIGAFSAQLDGANVVPPNASAASGSATFSFDTSNNVLSYHVAFRDLEGDEQSASIRGPALAGGTGPALHTLSLGSPKIGHWSYDESVESDLLSGRSYLSIRSAAFPNGELRGQIEPLGPTSATSQLTVRVLLWDDLSGGFATNLIPAAVARLEVEVSGADMATLTQAVPLGAPPLVVPLTVPKGMARLVVVRAYDAGDQVIYRSATLLNIENATHSIQPTLWSAGDVASPSFAGVTGATRVAGDAIAVQWSAASDDHASTSEIAYAIYMATTSGGQDFSTPLYAADVGQTSYTVRGLAAGQAYHFVVRALDPAGNLDTNAVEASATTFSAGTGQYVDSNTGVDVAGCGTLAAPCKTITQALIQTPGNEPIYIARGVYDTAAGEVFPLRLKDGTALYGDLAFVQTLPTSAGGTLRGTLVPTSVILSSASSPVIYGASGAHIGGLHIEDGINSSLGTIDADGDAISVAWCVLKGSVSASLVTRGIRLAAGSSVRDSVIKDFKDWGIIGYGDGLVIFRNTIVRTAGIVVEAGDWVISRNALYDNTFAIAGGAADPTEGGQIFLNTIHGNYQGIQLGKTWGVEILGNSIRNNENNGISLGGDTNPPPTSTLIAGNSLVGNGIGIFISSAATATIVGNTIACNDRADLGSWGSQVIDARNNWWDHNPPTTYDDAESNLDGCEPDGVDVCTAEIYAGTPDPILDPANGTSSCATTAIGHSP